MYHLDHYMFRGEFDTTYFVLCQNPVNSHSQQMVQGLLGLLRLCPQEVANLRKELLIAARHILSTELRNSMHFFILLSVFLYHFFYNSGEMLRSGDFGGASSYQRT